MTYTSRWLFGSRQCRSATDQCGTTYLLAVKAFVNKRNHPGVRRAGVMLAAVLAVLMVVALVGAALTMSLLASARQLRQSEQQQQSLWLAESGMQRALAKLAASPDYKGETWNVPKDALDGHNSAAVTIIVEPAKEVSQGLLIRVESRYPDDPVHKIIFRRDRFVPAANQGASS